MQFGLAELQSNDSFDTIVVVGGANKLSKSYRHDQLVFSTQGLYTITYSNWIADWCNTLFVLILLFAKCDFIQDTSSQ